MLQIDEGNPVKITAEGRAIDFTGDKARITGAGTLQTTVINASTDTFTVDGTTVELLSNRVLGGGYVIFADGSLILDNGAVMRTEEGFTSGYQKQFDGSAETYTHPEIHNLVYTNGLYLRNGSELSMDITRCLDDLDRLLEDENLTESQKKTAVNEFIESIREVEGLVSSETTLSVTGNSKLKIKGFVKLLRVQDNVSVVGDGSTIEVDNQAYFDKVATLNRPAEKQLAELQLQYSRLTEMQEELQKLGEEVGTDDPAYKQKEAELQDLQTEYQHAYSQLDEMSLGYGSLTYLVQAGHTSITDGAKVSLNGFLPAWACSVNKESTAAGLHVENAEFSIVEDIPEEYREAFFIKVTPPYTDERADWLLYNYNEYHSHYYLEGPLAEFVNSTVRITTNAAREKIAPNSSSTHYTTYDFDGIVTYTNEDCRTPLLIKGGDVEIYGGGTRPALGLMVGTKGGSVCAAVEAMEEPLQIDKGDQPRAITSTALLNVGEANYLSPSRKSYFHSHPYVSGINVVYKATKGGKVGYSAEATDSSLTQTIDKKNGELSEVLAVADEGYDFFVWYDAEGKVVSFEESLLVQKKDGTYEAGTYTAKFVKTSDPLDKEELQAAVEAAQAAQQAAEEAKEAAEKKAEEAQKAVEAADQKVTEAQQAAEEAKQAAEEAKKAAEEAKAAAEAAKANNGSEQAQQAAAEAKAAAEAAQKAAEAAQKAAEDAAKAAGGEGEKPDPGKPDPVQPDQDRSQQMGADGTALGKGASAEAAEAFITSANTDVDPAGTVFLPLQLKSVKQTQKSLKLNWKKVTGAKKYMIFGNKCGTNNKMKKLTTVTKNSYNVKKAVKKIQKGKYYKFMVVALDENNNVVATSKVVHAVTKGSKKYGNHKAIKLQVKQGGKLKAVKKATLKVGKKLTLKATQIPASKKLKVANHTKVRFESTDANVASVSKKGVITAKGTGTCIVYAYAQNGVSKTVKVTVK